MDCYKNVQVTTLKKWRWQKKIMPNYTKWLNIKIVGTCTETSLQVWLQWHMYDYSFKKDEINAMPILVR
jgi:hypothetical protein